MSSAETTCYSDGKIAASADVNIMRDKLQHHVDEGDQHDLGFPGSSLTEIHDNLPAATGFFQKEAR